MKFRNLTYLAGLILLTSSLSYCSLFEEEATPRLNRESENQTEKNQANQAKNQANQNSSSSSGQLRRSNENKSTSVEYVQLNNSEFSKDDCDESIDCSDICRDIFSVRTARGDCENLPQDMVEDLINTTYTALDRLNGRSIKSINIRALGKMIDIGEKSVTDLVNNWSISQLRLFLIFIASNPASIEMLMREDSSNVVFQFIIDKYVEKHRPADHLYQIFTLDLGSYTQTFFHFASKSKNEKAFGFVFDFIQDNSSKCDDGDNNECHVSIQKMICARKQHARSSDIPCPNQSGRRGVQSCYVQGGNVWSSIEEIRREKGAFPSNPFPNNVERINQDLCNNFCGDDEDGKCTRILQ